MMIDLDADRLVVVSGLVAMVAAAGLLLWESERRRRAILRVATKRGGPVDRLVPRAGGGLGLLRRLGTAATQAAMFGRKEVEETSRTLVQAGLRSRAVLHQVMGLRTVGLLAGLIGPLAWSQLVRPMPPTSLLLSCLIGALLGWRGPMVVFGRLAAWRRARLEQELPNVIDLLVVCGEAGLSIEAGIDRIIREMSRSSKEIAEEFTIIAAEIRLLPDRSVAFSNFHERVRTDGARVLATTLAQAMRYGTPLGVALRVLSGEMRSAHQLRMEERAARLPVLITIPMILCILPCVFIVGVGPSFMELAKAFKGM